MSCSAITESAVIPKGSRAAKSVISPAHEPRSINVALVIEGQRSKAGFPEKLLSSVWTHPKPLPLKILRDNNCDDVLWIFDLGFIHLHNLGFTPDAYPSPSQGLKNLASSI